MESFATFKKLKYVYSRWVFDCNQLDLYKNIFNHQPFNGLSIIFNNTKLFAKKTNIDLDENKSIKYIN